MRVLPMATRYPSQSPAVLFNQPNQVSIFHVRRPVESIHCLLGFPPTYLPAAETAALPPARLQQFFRVESGDVEAAHGFADLGGALRHHLGLIVMGGGTDDGLGALRRVR